MGGRVLVPPVLQEFKELLRAAFLEQAHESRANGFHLGRGDLCDATIAVYVGSCDLLEFEVASDVGVDEHLCELSVGHHVFGDQVDCVVAVPAEVRRGALARAELVVELWTAMRMFKVHGGISRRTSIDLRKPTRSFQVRRDLPG